MRIDYVYVKEFKNLSDFSINIDPSKMETVLLGQNAVGKSNFIEVLVLIFKFLDLKKSAPFEYEIRYSINDFYITAQFRENHYSFFQHFEKERKEIRTSSFFENKRLYLPKYVFTYYSGISNKLKDHFDDHQKRFYDKSKKSGVTKDDVDDLRRLFYVQLIHSYFVLLAYFSFKEDEELTIKFLRENLKINDLESVLFVLHKPSWKGKGDKRFWGAKGLVEEFLTKLWENATAPIYNKQIVKIDFRRNTNKELLYLFVRNKDNLQNLATFYNSNTDFFKALESTYISDLIEEVKVRVRKVDVDGKITFKDLSEGEQQLLTVLGLLKFTKDDESLILLDEPDTHLNPLWKWKYKDFLNDVVKRPASTQIFINTHDPLVVGSMCKEEVRIFQYNSSLKKIEVQEPDVDPKGLGVAGILTSDLFGLPTILDKETQLKLDEKRFLQAKLKEGRITQDEKIKLLELEDKLERLGFTKYQRDPLYQKFVEAMSKLPNSVQSNLSKEEEEQQNLQMIAILEDLLDQENF